MNLRKITSLLTAGTLCLSLLAACGGQGASSETASGAASTGESAAEPVTLRMMVFGQTEVYEQINEEFFELNPDLKGKAAATLT